MFWTIPLTYDNGLYHARQRLTSLSSVLRTSLLPSRRHRGGPVEEAHVSR